MSELLVIFARITPKPEFLGVARQAVVGIISATRAEPGCHAFTLHDDGDGNGCLYLYEIWENDAALATHHDQPYTQAVFDSYREWLSQPVEITKLRPIDGNGECFS